MDDTKIIGKTEHLRLRWKSLEVEHDFDEDPIPLLNQVYTGCTQSDAKVSPQAVQSKAALFRRPRSTRVTDEKNLTKEPFSSKKITSWCFDMAGHAEKCADRYCELANKTASSFQQAATPCTEDHL